MLQWTLAWNSSVFIQENVFENVVCKMAAILSQPQCDNSPQSRIVEPHSIRGGPIITAKCNRKSAIVATGPIYYLPGTNIIIRPNNSNPIMLKSARGRSNKEIGPRTRCKSNLAKSRMSITCISVDISIGKLLKACNNYTGVCHTELHNDKTPENKAMLE